ncbi:MAG: DUF3048 domain-containing protein [Syntrophomonas sp.]|uniref:RCC1 domain-containing protein n=1 Tax=Syntrophomonas sp. TaxID=2053627 RepID=UPI0026307C40|nr:DUF3048 domain-containing protein [Syntrophomonas sp.]MDD2510381.1 DUF3048 domain-containing protein [Syntrophomonas sp.]MDD3879088.1 DUF3048 domain-containing protein [Syntrophomonas sp.]MDD4626861.1 DUF3048 domain-containing protein [Syntrophomonas sp.]
MSFNNRLKGQVLIVYLVIITLLVGTGIGYNPSMVLADEPAVIAIVAGGSHSLALKNDGSVWAWGNNQNGQLGDGSTTCRSYPVQVKDGTGVGFLEGIVAIAAGGNHSLALKNDGTVWAWGGNYNGQLGNDSRQENPLPIQVISPDGSTYLGNIHDIIAGPSQSFARDDSGQAWAWGNNYYGQLGDGTNNYNCTRPVLVQGLSSIKQITSGSEHTLALKDDGTVWAWGQGSLGTGTSSSRLPLQVMGPEGEGYLTGITMVDASNWSSAAVSVMGAVYQWGSYPQIVEGLDEISAIAMNDYNNLVALKRDGSVWQNQYSTYAMVVGLSDIVAISGYRHCMSLDAQGKVWAWGNNDYGQLGNGSTEYSSVPVEVDFGKPYDNVAPEVVSTNPVANASEVPLNSAITINFSEPIKSGSNFSALRLLDKDGNTISLGKKSIVDNTLILEPLNDLIFAMEYTILIPADAVLDLSNNQLNSEFCFSFVAGSTISVTGVNLDRAQFILPVDGPPVALQATITPLNASNKNLSWSSSNPEVATVDTNGLITPLSIGLTVITVTTEDGGLSAQCSVSVAEWVTVTGVSLEQNTLNLGLGQTASLKAIITPTDASNQKLYWTSDHSNIAQVDSEGRVTAQSPGEAIITVTTEDGSYTANCTCTVSDIVVDFPDPNLRVRIRQEIGKATGDIRQSDLLKLNSFSATYTGITSLEGLQYLSNITSLYLNGNEIKDLSPLGTLANLRYLNINGNRIKKLGPLEQLTALQEINLSHNQVRDIEPLSNLLQLKRIYLNYNQIRDVTPLLTNSNNGGLRSTGNDPWERGFVDLRWNYLDINEDSATASDIQTLLDRGVDVQFTPQMQAPPDEKPQDINVVSLVIDNHPDARPQTGLNDAEVVFETTVAPGITRLLAVYDPGNTFAEVGPVRSARRNLVELAAGYSGAMLHCGGSTDALHFLNRMPLMDFDEIYGSGNYFFRSLAQQAPHNLYTNKDLILQGIEEKNGELATFNKALPIGEMSGGNPATQVTVCFRGQSYDTVFKWDSPSNKYQRYEKGLPCLLADGSPIKTTNVLVLSTPHEKIFDPVAGEWVVQAKVTGEGPASFYRDGQIWNGRWKKDSSSAGFIFTVDGQTMHFSSGTSWVLFDELPAITSTDPLDGQHSVDVSRNLYVYLNNELIAGPDFGLIKMYDEKSNPILTEQELLKKSLVIRPTAPLAYNCYYTLRIPAAALVDAQGKSLDQETVITFRTRDKYDYNLTLGQGWNLVSVSRPVQSFELVQEDVEAWLAYALKDGKLGWITDPDEIRKELNNPASAVFIKTVRPSVMRFGWAETDDPHNTFASKELGAGWNLVGSSSRAYLKNNLASLRFSNGQGLTQAYNPGSFNARKTDSNHAVWSSQLLDISEWQANEIMSPWDGYWVFLRGTNQIYSIPVYYRHGGVVVPTPIQPPQGTSGTGGSINDEEID